MGRKKDELSPEELERIAGGTGQQTTGKDGDDTLMGGFGDDTMDGAGGDDLMGGGFGNDSMDGGWGNDLVDGGAGNDTLEGGWGDDTLNSPAGDNVMDGGGGDDWLVSGSGDDTLTGGTGADTFVFGQQDGSDTVTDFDPAEDRLVFQGLGDPSELGVTTQDGNTVITYGDTIITLEGVEMTPEQVYGCIMDDPDSIDVQPANVIL